MKQLLWTLCAVLLTTMSTTQLNAQIETPAPSPSSKLTQDVGLTEVTIEYSRPGVKGRTVFAKDGLVPFGKPWRFGANAATKFTFSKDVKVGGVDMKAGSYAVLAKPDAEEWELMFFNYESGSWSSYLEKDPAGVVKATPREGNHPVESFTLSVDDLKNDGAKITMHWANTMISLPLSVGTADQVQASIDRVMNGPSKDDYYAAASYYLSEGKDLKQAKEWIEKATTGDDPKFWQVRRKALIYAELGMKKEAIAAAKQSMELAQKAGNEDYVRMNKKSIAEWSK
jgi:hypothetical protein